MKVEPASRTPHASPDSRLRVRLAAYSRYAAIVQEQLRALREENMARFDELAGTRAEIQEELEAASEGGQEEAELDEEGKALLNGAAEELGRAMVQDQEIESRLLRLRAEAGGQIRALSGRKENARQYLTESERVPEERPHRLNVRL
jgi:hypothetical protein